MVTAQTKTQGIATNPLISSNQTPKLDNKLSKNQTPKSRQQIYQENYQKNKEKRKIQAKERYIQKKQKEQLSTQQQSAKYYQAENIKVLMSLKEYTELNQEKRKIWLNFMWTFKDLKELGTPNNIIEVMKLREEADNLIRDYWATANNEIKKRQNWHNLSQEKKDRLIRYWGYEKARKENNLLTTSEQLEQQSQAYLKAIELAKFHEEGGKVKCECYSCAEQKRIQGQIKAEIAKESEVKDKVQCPDCQKWVKKLDADSGVCPSCLKKYE